MMNPSSNVGFRNIVGRCPAMREVYELIEQDAPEDFSVLVVGSSGTGKEAVARAIHDGSPRRNGPFVAFNCASFTPDLAARELFGHVRGAFTGANEAKVGLIEKANHGTLFFDEVGESRPDLQAMLLRVLQEHEFLPVGSTEVRKVDVRLVSATNADLVAKVEQGLVRSDFLYRVCDDEIRLPDLAERGDDVLLLAEHFVAEYAREGRPAALSPEAKMALRQYPFPGNVRELKSMIRCALARSRRDGLISPKHLGLDAQGARLKQSRMIDVQPWAHGTGQGTFIPAGATLEEGKRLQIQASLRAHGGNKTEAAKELGVDRSMLQNVRFE